MQWCHGAPSLIPVLVKAYELLESHSSAAAETKMQVLNAAKQAADVVWERGLLTKVGGPFFRLIVTSCCKIAGTMA